MVRRLQLLEPEHRSSGRRLAALGNRVREGLLRDNRVIPAVLGVLALLIFAWVIAGALTGGSNYQGGKQASNQGSVSQAPEKSSGSESTGTPAPEVENRDTDSYSAFKAKDPFALHDVIENTTGGRASGSSDGDRSGARSSDGDRSSKVGGGSGDRSSLGDSGSRRGVGQSGAGPGGIAQSDTGQGSSEDDAGQNSTEPSGIAQSDTGQGSGGQGSSRDLFNSGGDLPP